MDIKKNLFASMLYSKAKNEKGNVVIENKKNNEILKTLDLNKDGTIDKTEAQKSLFDINGDNKISSKDLGIYTAFISFSENFKNNENKLSNKDFDIDGNGKLDDIEKELQELIDSDNNNEFDEDMLDLIAKDKKFDDRLIKTLKDEIKALDAKINPNENDRNRIIDAKTGNILSKTKIKNGTEYKVDYMFDKKGMPTKKISDSKKYNTTCLYHEGTNILKSKEVKNKENGMTTIYTYNKKGEPIKKTTQKEGSNEIKVYTDFDNNDQPQTMTIYKDNKPTKEEYKIVNTYFKNTKNVSKRKFTNNSNADTITILYDENHKTTKKEIRTNKSNKIEIYENFDNIGNPQKKTITKINTNTKTEYEIKNTYFENTKIIKKTQYTNKTNNETTTNIFNKNNQKIKKTVVNKNETKTYNYTNFDGNYPTSYTVEYNRKNGIHTKSTIQQKKLSDGYDYITSSKNYKYEGKDDKGQEIWLLTSTLSTVNENKENEGTKRKFYFYNDKHELIKDEETFALNKSRKSTNSYQLKERTITTYDPKSQKRESTVKFKDGKIITTTYSANGTIKETKEKSYEEIGRENHNPKKITAKEFLTEAKKYEGYNRLDGSYSIFGTNGSACATFVTYLMYQMEFDITSIKKRTTKELETRAKEEGRYTNIKDVFAGKTTNSPKIGDILTTSRNGGTHTTIVENVTHTKDGKIIIDVFGYEDNNGNNGICKGQYIIENEKGKDTVKIGDQSGWKIGICDYLSE